MISKRHSILAICGSTKSKSSSLAVLKHIQAAYADSLHLNIYTQIAELPHFNPELEDPLPRTVAELRRLIKNADSVHPNDAGHQWYADVIFETLGGVIVGAEPLGSSRRLAVAP